MIAKEHEAENGIILSIVDDEILGKKFEQGKFQLDLSAEFYCGEKKSEDEIIEMMRRAYIINIAGKKSVDFALKNNFIAQKAILTISGIPHAECIILRSE
jgi:hypothetical protein